MLQADSQMTRPVPRLQHAQALSPQPAFTHHDSRSDLVSQSEDVTLNAYQTRGGVARGDELVSLVRTRADQPLSRVARWIVERDALHFRCGHETVFPLFQFDLADMSVRGDVRCVMAELAAAFDDADIAHWFVRPNAWIANRRPVDALTHDAAGVIAAARADRYMLLG